MAVVEFVVVGMHRSGTSAAAGCLARLGYDPGTGLLEEETYKGWAGKKWNPKGFYEKAAVNNMHNRVLAYLGGKWYVPPQISDYIWTTSKGTKLIEGMANFIENEDGDFIKDPRMTLLPELWRGVCLKLGINLKVIIVRRDKNAIVDSFKMMWGQTPLGAERERHLRALIDTYTDGIEKWKKLFEHSEVWLHELFEKETWQRVQRELKLIHHGERQVA
jgi:hypothetical protein